MERYVATDDGGWGGNAPIFYRGELIAFSRNQHNKAVTSASVAAIARIAAAAVVDISYFLDDIPHAVQDVRIEVAIAVVGNLFSEADIVFQPLHADLLRRQYKYLSQELHEHDC